MKILSRTNICSMSFLNKHVEALEHGEDSITSNIEMFNQDADNSDSKFYSLKSLKVKWEDYENTYMHVFFDITNIK